MLAEESLAEAANFLEPVLRPSKRDTSDTDVSLIGLLLPRCMSDGDKAKFSDRTVVALEALHLLKKINYDLTLPEASEAELDEVLQTPQKRRIIRALIDIVSIEGIHPFLETGVGIPLEKRLYTTLKQWEISLDRTNASIQWDSGAFQLLHELQELRRSPEISRMMDDRILVDFLALEFQAVYSPSVRSVDTARQLPGVIQSIETTKLLPTIASLLHPGAPAWLKLPLSTTLACAPVRTNGVRETINFLANAQATKGSLGDKDATPSTGPLITTQTLDKASQLMCTVPSSIEPDAWFESIGPQLLVLLSSEDLDEQKTASYIIGAILSRRQIGSPGTPGWRWLALPLLGNINPSESSGLPQVWDRIKEVIPEILPLHWAVSCLSRLLLQHPNLGLIKRLGSRTLLHLWAISCVSKARPETRPLLNYAARVLAAYTSVVGPDVILKIVNNFFFTGTDTWHYTLEDRESGEVECIIAGKSSEMIVDLGGAELIRKLELNMNALTSLLDELNQNDICNAFVVVLDFWASNTATEDDRSDSQDLQPDAKTNLVATKVVHTMLEKYKAVFASKPVKMIPLVKSLLDRFLHLKEQRKGKMTIGGLEISIMLDGSHMSESDIGGDDFTGLASFALGLLTVIFMDDQGMESLMNLDGIRNSLQVTLSSFVSAPDVPQTLMFPAQAILMQLDLMSKGKGSVGSSDKNMVSDGDNDAAHYRQALTNISSSLAPIRAEGLTTLNSLIKKSSPVVSGLATIALLVALLKEDDEYTNLNAANSISLLVSVRQHDTIAQLVETYVDPDEASSLEVRLRLGEAIQKSIKAIDRRLSVESGTIIAQGMIAVAGRRAVRAKEVERRAREAKQRERERKRAEREWGGEVPELPEEFREEVTPADEAAAKILEKWAGSGKEEDFRVRASALSIIGTLLAHSLANVQETLIEDIVQLCLLVLQREQDDGAAILRRSAIITLEGLVDGLDNTRDAGGHLEWSNARRMLQEVVRVLEVVRDNDDDDTARGHAYEVLKMVEAGEAQSLEIKLRGEDMRMDLGGRLAGLNVEPEVHQSSRPKIEEIE